MKIITKKSEKSLIEEFISNFRKEILKKKKKNKRFSFVLAGGKSPKKLYKKLSTEEINWDKIDLFWGDERYVTHKSKHSNFKLAFEQLIKKISIKKKNIYPIYTDKKISITVDEYSDRIKNYFKNKKISFDYFLLGMGEDGHVASIFSDNRNLNKKKIASYIHRNDFDRVTLNLNVINNSKKIILWLNSKYKTKRYEKLKKLRNQVPVNNLNKKNIFVYKIKQN